MSKIGVKFGDVHSYDTWGLRLKAIHIGTPEVKTAYDYRLLGKQAVAVG